MYLKLHRQNWNNSIKNSQSRKFHRAFCPDAHLSDSKKWKTKSVKAKEFSISCNLYFKMEFTVAHLQP